MLVPRRYAGAMIGASATAFSGLLMVAGWGDIRLSAFTALVMLGPALDLAARGAHSRPVFVMRFALAGLAANMLAMGAKWIAIPLELETGGRGFLAKWPASAFSFAVCGVLAGLVAAAVGLTRTRRRT